MYAAPPTPSATLAQSEVAPRHTVSEHSCGDICPSGEAFAVSNNRHSHSADLRREVEIQQLGREIEGHLADVALINNREPHVFLDFADAALARGKADLARKRMERLIAERSPEQKARMQRESDERMAREPGAERA